MLMELFTISLTAILVENFVLVQFMGICPFLGVSKKVDTALGMGMAVTFVMSLSNLMTFLAEKYILKPLGMEYLQTIVFILIIASLVQFVEMFLQKSLPALYSSLGIYLPLFWALRSPRPRRRRTFFPPCGTALVPASASFLRYCFLPV